MRKYTLELKSGKTVIDKRYFNTLKECEECVKFHRAYTGIIRLSKTNEIKCIVVNC